MSGQALALIASLTYAFCGIVIRRAVIRVSDVTSGTIVSVAISVPFFLIILLATGKIRDITGFAGIDYVWLSAAGIFTFVIARSLYFYSTQLVGANITGILTRVDPLVPFTVGVSIFGEPLSWQLITGIFLILIGATVAGLTPQKSQSDSNLLSRTMVKAIFFGIGAGLTRGTSTVLIKLGLISANLPIAGAFISFSAATIGMTSYLFRHDRRDAFVKMDVRTVTLFCIIGLLASIAQLLRFIALSKAPVSVVAPLFSTLPIFTVLLSFLLNRRLEFFGKTVIFGAIAVVAGTILLI